MNKYEFGVINREINTNSLSALSCCLGSKLCSDILSDALYSSLSIIDPTRKPLKEHRNAHQREKKEKDATTSLTMNENKRSKKIARNIRLRGCFLPNMHLFSKFFFYVLIFVYSML